jgi:hypothetical protein
MKRVMEMLGLRRLKRKEVRGDRKIEAGQNDIDNAPIYKEEIRAAVGAVMGDSECIQKVVCAAGSHMKFLKGKDIIFGLLEKFTPKKWRDTLKLAKQATISQADCNFKCLED